MNGIVDALAGSLAPARPEPRVEGGVPAAVLVPVIDLPDPVLVLTKRTETVRDHKGEISFPGGVRHPEDPSLVATALRETEEELAIPAGAVEVLGMLPSTHTVVSGYVIVPYVGLLQRRPPMRPSAIEVAEVLELEVARFADVERAEGGNDPAGEFQTWFAYQLDGHLVWGATGRILHTFLDALAAGGWSPPVRAKEG
ncbi:MAG: NUDIX hydrolase [Actinomycetota bacterium]